MPALPPFRDEADPIWERRVHELELAEPKGKAGGVLSGEYPNPKWAPATEYIDISEGEINNFANLQALKVSQPVTATLLTNTEKILNSEQLSPTANYGKFIWRVKGQFAGTTKILGIKAPVVEKPVKQVGESTPIFLLYNVGTEKVAFVSESAEAGVEATSKLILKEAEVVLSTNGFIRLWYDRETTRWREW